jgi:hypothetical protein
MITDDDLVWMKQTPRQVGLEEIADLIDEVERLRKIKAIAIKRKNCQCNLEREIYSIQLEALLQK